MKTINQFAYVLLILVISLVLLVVSCDNVAQKITSVNDYNSYLEIEHNEMLQLAQEDFLFWEKKHEKEPNQFPYLVKAAASLSQLFTETGNIEYLIDAEHKLLAANKKTNYTNVGYLRSLARNYISQHKFKEALKLLKNAEAIGERLNATQKMLFDVNFELGNYTVAKQYLNKIENFKDFDYLIRLSKWSDHQGDLEAAILYLEKATEIIKSSKNEKLMHWAYTNLADFYGHNGQIENAYNHYLKALEIDNNDAYAKKGIAWIVYSHEHKPEEALRILNAISKSYQSPDYYLLKAEIAEYMGDFDAKGAHIASYINEVKNQKYGNMYNKYNAILYAEDLKEIPKALTIAKTEVNNRSTPQSYDLLAWTYYNSGNNKEALHIMEKYVANKTFEPEALYHLAQIYKANKKFNEANVLKKELLECTFELGPLMTKKIENI